jgi:S1-C subfamily serine protease
MRAAAACCLFLLLCGSVPPRAQERLSPAPALALQEALEQAIARAEPAVACVLVSRSDAYRRFNASPSPDNPGQLGRFNADDRLAVLREEQREERRAILRLSLHHPEHVPEGYGSGVVLDGNLVLTCAHVVRGATKVYVRLSGGRGSYADIHALDPRSDLAVLRLLDPPPGLKPLPRGDGGKVRKGQFVVLVSHPFAAGFRDGSPSASWGIVSNLRRRSPGDPNEIERNRGPLHQYGTLIQTDARIEAGSSGGALVNLNGELIGLATALAAVSGADAPGGLVIPLDAGMKRILDVLARGEEVEYGFLGVEFRPDPVPGQQGVRVERAATGSPAERAGLTGGDFIVALDGVPVRDYEDLLLQVGLHLAGSSVPVEVMRDAQRRTLTVRLAKAYVPGPVIAAQRPAPRRGLVVDYASVHTQRARLSYVPEGVVIREVRPGSPADRALLQPDKIIARVNGRLVRTPAEFYQEMDNAGPRVELTLLSEERKESTVTLEK